MTLQPCPRCGAPLADDGQCPRCLLRLGLELPPRAADAEGQPAGAASTPSRRPEPLPLEEVARRFPHLEILGLLGQGGMGVVYRALDLRLERLVAVKVLIGEADSKRAERMRREAHAISRLNHPNIMVLFDLDEHEGSPFLVSELLVGQPMSSRGPRPGDATVLRLMSQVASALQYAHAHGVVHRDVKPANVMVIEAPEPTAKLMDFGLSLLADRARLSVAGRMVGTPAYMAPEQVAGEEIDARTDLYALGVMMYELLTGKHPHHAPSVPALLMRILRHDPTPPRRARPDLPQDIESLILDLLKRVPDQRPRDASEVVARLSLLQGATLAPHGPSIPSTLPAVAGRSRSRVSARSGPVPPPSGSSQTSISGPGTSLSAAGAHHGAITSGGAAIAVVPFAWLGRDADQEYVADGITEELITGLSRLRWFHVTARSTCFAYKGRSADIRELSRELGVRYVLQGSLRRAGNRVRVSAQLADGESGSHLWARSYDRDLGDVFALQDEITHAVVTAIEPEVYAAETVRAERKPPGSLDAWDYVMKSLWHIGRFSERDLRSAQELLRRAIDLDPVYAQAHSLMAYACALLLNMGWGEPARVIAEARASARAAIELDDQDPWAHLALGYLHSAARRPDDAIAAIRTALVLRPSFPVGHGFLGRAFAMAHRPDDAIRELDRAVSLSNESDAYTAFYYGAYALAHFVAGRYADGAEWARRSVMLRPEFVNLNRIHAVCLALCDRVDDARVALDEVLVLYPGLDLQVVEQTSALVRAEDRALYIEGLRRASRDTGAGVGRGSGRVSKPADLD